MNLSKNVVNLNRNEKEKIYTGLSIRPLDYIKYFLVLLAFKMDGRRNISFQRHLGKSICKKVPSPTSNRYFENTLSSSPFGLQKFVDLSGQQG